MAKLTKGQREQLIFDLSGTFGGQFLQCDGYLICANVEKYKQTLVISVYVDGKVDPKNIVCLYESELNNLNDIQKKFMRHSKSARYKPGFIKYQEKNMGKKWCKNNGIYEKVTTIRHWFNTPTAFVSHINKAVDDIEIISVTEYTARLDAKESANAETL